VPARGAGTRGIRHVIVLAVRPARLSGG
jgi:hypothetical protein